MPRKPKPAADKATNSAQPASAKPVLLSGGNPQIAKADGDAPVQAYIAAMPDVNPAGRQAAGRNAFLAGG